MHIACDQIVGGYEKEVTDIPSLLKISTQKIPIMQLGVRNDDAGRRLLEIVLPFQVLAVAQIAIQNYPFPVTGVCASDDNNLNSGSEFVSNDDHSIRRHDTGNLAGCCQSFVPQMHSVRGFAAQ